MKTNLGLLKSLKIRRYSKYEQETRNCNPSAHEPILVPDNDLDLSDNPKKEIEA